MKRARARNRAGKDRDQHLPKMCAVRKPLLIAISLTALAVASPALGDERDQKRTVDARIDSLRGDLKSAEHREVELRRAVADVTNRIRDLEARVGDVALRLDTLEEDLALHQRRLDQLNRLYTMQTARLKSLKRQQQLATIRLNERLVAIYESREISTFELVLGAGSLSEMLDRVEYTRYVAIHDQRIAREVASAKRSVATALGVTSKLRGNVAAATQVIRSRTDQARSVRNELLGARGALTSSRREKLLNLSQLTDAERGLVEEIDALGAQSASLGAAIQAAQAAQQPAPTPPPGRSNSGPSGFAWPAAGSVTSSYGWRWGRMHEGIDIGAGSGAPIRAAASGTVIYCGWMSGYGNLVVVDHGGGVSTAYAHQSTTAVTCGQNVSQGSTVGYIGSTGNSTGPHLHFEVRVRGAAVDPMGYL